jgi:kynurenine 3-monooxygenase
MTDDRPYIVVGAGLGGSMMAALLGRSGRTVEVLERRADARRGPVEAGRSINLAISARGLNALDHLGLKDEVLRIGIPLYGRMIHPVRGPLAFQPYGSRRQAINSVARADLNRLLLDVAEARGRVAIGFNRRCVGVDLERAQVTTVDARDNSD